MEMILNSPANEAPESDMRTQYSEALRQGIEKHGIPSQIIVDDGKDFVTQKKDNSSLISNKPQNLELHLDNRCTCIDAVEQTIKLPWLR